MLINDVNAKIEDGEEPIMFNWENLKNPLLSPTNAPSCRTERSAERTSYHRRTQNFRFLPRKTLDFYRKSSVWVCIWQKFVCLMVYIWQKFDKMMVCIRQNLYICR